MYVDRCLTIASNLIFLIFVGMAPDYGAAMNGTMMSTTVHT